MMYSTQPDIIEYSIMQPLSNLASVPFFYVPNITEKMRVINYNNLLKALNNPNKEKVLKQWFNYSSEFEHVKSVMEMVNIKMEESKELKDLQNQKITDPSKTVKTTISQDEKTLQKIYDKNKIELKRYKSISHYIYYQLLSNNCNKSITKLKDLPTIPYKLYNQLKKNEIQGIIQYAIQRAYTIKLSQSIFEKKIIETKKENVVYEDISELPILYGKFPIKSYIVKTIEYNRKTILKNMKVDQKFFYKIYVIYQYIDQYVRNVIRTQDRTHNIPILVDTLRMIGFIEQLPFNTVTIEAFKNIIIYTTCINLLNDYPYTKLYDWITSKLHIIDSLNLKYVISELKSKKFGNLYTSLVEKSDNQTREIIQSRYKTLICSIFNTLLPSKSNLELILYIQEYLQQHGKKSALLDECVPFYKMLDSKPKLRRNLKDRVKIIVTLIDLKNIESYQAFINFIYDQIGSSICDKNEYNFTAIFSINTKVIYHIKESKSQIDSIKSLQQDDYKLKKDELETEIINLTKEKQKLEQQLVEESMRKEASGKKELLQSLQEDDSEKRKIKTKQDIRNVTQKLKYKSNMLSTLTRKQKMITNSLQIKDKTHFLSPSHESPFTIDGKNYTSIIQYIYTLLVNCFSVVVPNMYDSQQLVLFSLDKNTSDSNSVKLNKLLLDINLYSYKCLLNISLYYKFMTHSDFKQNLILTGDKYITAIGEKKVIIEDTIFYQSPDYNMKQITPSFLMILRNMIQKQTPIDIKTLMRKKEETQSYKTVKEFTKDDEEIPEDISVGISNYRQSLLESKKRDVIDFDVDDSDVDDSDEDDPDPFDTIE